MAKRVNMSAVGIVTYWATAETSIDRLRAGCLKVDPGLEKLLPQNATPMNALREALAEVFPGHLVRKLKADGFAVVREDRGEDENEYDHVAAAWFGEPDGQGDRQIVAGDKVDAATARRIRHAYSGQRGVLQPVQVGTFLGRVLGEYLGGTMLRPKVGGVYWLPEERADKWQAIADAVEAAAAKGGATSVYVLRHAMDEQGVRAVRDAIVHEATTEAARISDEVMAGQLGAKALRTREREALQLIAKVKRYEELLDVGLAGIRRALGEVKDAAAAAAVLASVDAEAEPVGAGRD
jgi:hypothetical protein